MISKLFSKDKNSKLSEREHDIKEFGKLAEKWNLEEIQDYIRGRKANLLPSDIGLAYILTRFNTNTTEDKKAPNGKRREFEPYDRPERTKKGLDIVIAIASNKKLATDSFELLKEFNDIFSDVIIDLDTKLSQTYVSKLKDAYKNAEVSALVKAQIASQLSVRF